MFSSCQSFFKVSFLVLVATVCTRIYCKRSRLSAFACTFYVCLLLFVLCTIMLYVAIYLFSSLCLL